MIIAYDGTPYSGWEKKQGRDTVQGKMEDALSRLCAQEAKLIAAGRTDAGVHAEAMTANVHLDTDMTEAELFSKLNRYLPETIAVTELKECSERFHARYNARGKTYRYTCYVGESKAVFDRKYVTALGYAPDMEKMRRAAAYMTGEHDFISFCSNRRFKKNSVRTVDKIDIIRRRDRLVFTFHGTGFLQSMVRIMVGTLLDVGRGRIAPESIPGIIAGRDRSLAGETAPAKGLCLVSVDY